MEKQGKLLIIGFGPGALEHITGRALAALEESEAVIGYTTYVDLIRPLLRHQEIVGTGMTEEVSRAQEAVRRAEAGQSIAVISSGDAGVYGMAGLVYEVLIERGWSRSQGVQVEVIPGISAIQSCSSLLGAPIMHDSCTISLSDHLTPWDSIAARVEAAAAADFVIAFYNPRSGRRTRQIEEARNILLRYRDPATPVGIVKSAYRDAQQTIVTTLQEMLEQEIGMLSTVVVGNSATVVYEDLMITPRGYERKYSLGAKTQALKPHERLRTAAEPWSLAAAESGQAAGAAVAGGTNAVVPGREADSSFELEISPAVGSRGFSGDQMKLLAELAGGGGQLVYTKDGYFLLRGSRSEETEAGARLLEAGLNVSRPGDYVKVKTCGFCELRRSGALSTAVRLHELLHGLAVPRELHISVAGCGMACSSAVLDDIGLVCSRGSYELYLGGKKSGRGAHAGAMVREGMDEEEAVAAVAAAVEDYRVHGREKERYHAFRERMDSAKGGAAHTSGNNNSIEGVQTMRTVLLVGHGSRIQAGNEELLEFTRLLADRKPELKVETCFIELASPSIAGGIARCIEGGAAEIYVVPIILFAAGHSKLDIPMAIDEAKLRYPGVKFIYGRPLGVQERAVDILLERIQETERLPMVQEKAAGGMNLRGNGSSTIEDKDTIVLLMGRGGSDPDANSDLYKISRLLWERTGYRSVESCFIAIAKPSLPEGLERCLALGARRIIVLPYLLFTGVLMQQFAERVAQFAAGHPELEVEIGGTLGAHPLLIDMLAERIEETLEGRAFSNCDNCKFRDAASLHHHHHHHHGEEGHGGHGHGHHGHGHHSHEGHGHGHGHHEHAHHEHQHHCHGQHFHHECEHHGHEEHTHGRHDVTETAAPADNRALRQPR
ncbi:precorrin-3B C(17)-methyltransferase [Paenibacillus sp. FSL K6-1217]